MSDLSETPPTIPLRLATRPTAAVADYLEILKPRVMSLVVFTGWSGSFWLRAISIRCLQQSQCCALRSGREQPAP